MTPGGKGANQAVAAARLGAETAFIGRVGDDPFADTLRKHLAASGVNCDFLTTTANVATGAALIIVSSRGENAICVAPGANAHLAPADIDAAEPAFIDARVCVLQLEIPLPTVLRAISVARRHGAEVILDPAPAPARARARLFDADVLTPNQTEALALAGGATGGRAGGERHLRLARRLVRGSVKHVVLKLGAAGALVVGRDATRAIPAPRVCVVDTTGAGDAFTAALAVARAQGGDMADAARFAVAAGAAACMRFGAGPSMPTARQVARVLAGMRA